MSTSELPCLKPFTNYVTETVRKVDAKLVGIMLFGRPFSTPRRPECSHFGLVALSAEIMLFGRSFATIGRVDSCRRFESSEIVNCFLFRSSSISVCVCVCVSLSLSVISLLFNHSCSAWEESMTFVKPGYRGCLNGILNACWHVAIGVVLQEV